MIKTLFPLPFIFLFVGISIACECHLRTFQSTKELGVEDDVRKVLEGLMFEEDLSVHYFHGIENTIWATKTDDWVETLRCTIKGNFEKNQIRVEISTEGAKVPFGSMVFIIPKVMNENKVNTWSALRDDENKALISHVLKRDELEEDAYGGNFLFKNYTLKNTVVISPVDKSNNFKPHQGEATLTLFGSGGECMTQNDFHHFYLIIEGKRNDFLFKASGKLIASKKNNEVAISTGFPFD